MELMDFDCKNLVVKNTFHQFIKLNCTQRSINKVYIEQKQNKIQLQGAMIEVQAVMTVYNLI